MPDIAGLLKAEIVRLSNKTVRQHLGPVKSASAAHRRQIAALRKQVSSLERELAKLRRSTSSRTVSEETDSDTSKNRFVAKGLRSLRARLDLSAEDFGRLVGVSSQSVYNWEQEKSRPRPAQVAAIAAVRTIGKREALARLEQLGQTSGS